MFVFRRVFPALLFVFVSGWGIFIFWLFVWVVCNMYVQAYLVPSKSLVYWWWGPQRKRLVGSVPELIFCSSVGYLASVNTQVAMSIDVAAHVKDAGFYTLSKWKRLGLKGHAHMLKPLKYTEGESHFVCSTTPEKVNDFFSLTFDRTKLRNIILQPLLWALHTSGRGGFSKIKRGCLTFFP